MKPSIRSPGPASRPSSRSRARLPERRHQRSRTARGRPRQRGRAIERQARRPRRQGVVRGADRAAGAAARAGGRAARLRRRRGGAHRLHHRRRQHRARRRSTCGPGDEVLTSDEEHPGLLRRWPPRARGAASPSAGAVRASSPRRGRARTKLVACSHVSWITGEVVDCEALAATGAPVLLDGAQGLGAVPVDVASLGCDFYAASGQKWLCGPERQRLPLRARGPPATSAQPALARATAGRRARRPARSSALRHGSAAPRHPGWPGRAHGLGAGRARRARERGLRRRARARRATAPSALAERCARAGRRWRPRAHARSSRGRSGTPRGRRRAPRRARAWWCATCPAALRARLGRRLDERGRHRAPAARARRSALLRGHHHDAEHHAAPSTSSTPKQATSDETASAGTGWPARRKSTARWCRGSPATPRS